MEYLRIIEPHSTQHLPRYLSREGCSPVDFKTIEATFNAGVGRKVLFLLDLENANNLLDEGTDINRLLKLMTSIMAKNTGADYASLLIHNDLTDEWLLMSESGVAEPAVLEVCQQILIHDSHEIFKRSKSYLPCTDRLTVNSSNINLACTPLVSRGRVIGGIIIIKPGSREFSLYDIIHASIMGQWCSTKAEQIGLIGQTLSQPEYGQKLLSQVCRSQEEERRRVAAELHDGIAQWLVSATYDISACQMQARRNPDADVDVSLQRAKEILQNCIKEVRRTIADLRPQPIAELGLVGALNQSALALIETGAKCRVTVHEELPKLSQSEETTVFWIVQEAFNNIKKHAGASKVDVELFRQGGILTISVTDNGKGFDTGLIAGSNGRSVRLGIQGMKERARLLGGEFCVSSQPGSGTAVTLSFMVADCLDSRGVLI